MERRVLFNIIVTCDFLIFYLKISLHTIGPSFFTRIVIFQYIAPFLMWLAEQIQQQNIGNETSDIFHFDKNNHLGNKTSSSQEEFKKSGIVKAVILKKINCNSKAVAIR